MRSLSTQKAWICGQMLFRPLSYIMNKHNIVSKDKYRYHHLRQSLFLLHLRCFLTSHGYKDQQMCGIVCIYAPFLMMIYILPIKLVPCKVFTIHYIFSNAPISCSHFWLLLWFCLKCFTYGQKAAIYCFAYPKISLQLLLE